MTMFDSKTIDHLHEVENKMTRGVWKPWGMLVMATFGDGPSDVGKAVEVALTYFTDENRRPRTNDVDGICALRNVFVPLLDDLVKTRLSLLKYGTHRMGCPAIKPTPIEYISGQRAGACLCGLTTALEAIR